MVALPDGEPRFSRYGDKAHAPGALGVHFNVGRQGGAPLLHGLAYLIGKVGRGWQRLREGGEFADIRFYVDEDLVCSYAAAYVAFERLYSDVPGIQWGVWREFQIREDDVALFAVHQN